MKNLKNFILGPFSQKKHPNKNFLKTKIIWDDFTNLCTCNFMQKKSEKLYALIFLKIWKTSFWAHFRSFTLKRSKTRFFFKNLESVCRWFQRKTLNQQKKMEGISYDLDFVGPNIAGNISYKKQLLP